jgi:5-methylcytosine-specific restriction endonuclease McrA
MQCSAAQYVAAMDKRAADDTSGFWNCATLGCIGRAGKTGSYGSHADMHCARCHAEWIESRERRRLERIAQREADAQALKVERAAARERHRLRPCSACGGSRQGCRYLQNLCAACYARNARDVRHRASAARRAHKARVPHAPYSRTEIFAAYGGTCAYCGDPAEHLDHVVAISRGGADAAHNLLPACAPCNLSKGAKSLAEWAATF